MKPRRVDDGGSADGCGLRALLCGVRGSTPVSGSGFVGGGGATSCVAVPTTRDRWLILDAGTGFRTLADQLEDRPLRGSILLTHLHWDHVQGLPFLPNADRPDAEVDLSLPTDGGDPVELLARSMSPPHFPIGPHELRGRWRFSSLEPGARVIDELAVTAAEVHHKGGRTFGFRVESAAGSLAYVPDHAPRLAGDAERVALELVEGVDVLLHGGGYLSGERVLADSFGHATVDDAVSFATAAGVGRLVVVHHGPQRTDESLAEIDRALAILDLPAGVGRQGDWIDCSPGC